MEDNKIHEKDEEDFESLIAQISSGEEYSTDSAISENGEVSTISIDENSVYLDYNSNIELSNTFFNLPEIKDIETMMAEIEGDADEVHEKAQEDFELLIGKVSLTREENSRDFKTSSEYKEIKPKDQIVVCENHSGPKPQIMTTSNPLHYNQLLNSKYELMTEQDDPSAQQIISTGNRPQSVQSPIHTQSQQPLKSPDLYKYNQQQNRDFTSQHQTQVMANRSKQFPDPFQSNSTNQHFPQTCAVQPQSQMINSSSNQQHFSPSQHQTAYNSILTTASKQQHTTPSPQQHVTTSLTKCAIQATQPAIQQLFPILTTLVRPKNLSLPVTNAPNPDGVFTPFKKPGVNNTRPKSPNSTVLLPVTYSEVLDLSMPPVSENKAVRRSLQAIVHKHTGKGRCEKVQHLRQLKNGGQSKLHFARQCMAGIKDKDLEYLDSDGNNYLHIAVCKTDIYMIEALLERINETGKRNMIDKQNNLLRTPLYLAVFHNKPNMVRKLVNYGANINLEGITRGYTTEGVECAPIHCAASQGKEYYDTLKELFKSENMDSDIMNSEGGGFFFLRLIRKSWIVHLLRNPDMTYLVFKAAILSING